VARNGNASNHLRAPQENLAHTIEGHFDRYLEMLRPCAFYAAPRKSSAMSSHLRPRRPRAYPDISAVMGPPRAGVLREGYEEAVRQEGTPTSRSLNKTPKAMVRAMRRPEYVVVSYMSRMRDEKD